MDNDRLYASSPSDFLFFSSWIFILFSLWVRRCDLLMLFFYDPLLSLVLLLMLMLPCHASDTVLDVRKLENSPTAACYNEHKRSGSRRCLNNISMVDSCSDWWWVSPDTHTYHIIYLHGFRKVYSSVATICLCIKWQLETWQRPTNETEPDRKNERTEKTE